jgi:hypothetical protein
VKKIACVLVLLFPLSSCTLVGSALEVSLTSAVSGVMGSAARVSSMHRQYDHSHPRINVHSVCVIWNERVTVQDFVPVVQASLRRYNISSQVYAPGSEPSDCEAVLYYSAIRDWNRPMFTNDARPYLSQAQLVLRQRGAVVSQADFDVRDTGSSMWSDTTAKVGPMVESLIFGDESPSKMQPPAVSR